jgi:CRISPR-associated protein Csb1
MPNEPNTTLVDKFLEQDRVVIDASMELTNGSFFQPTGFPDIGACVFVDKEGRRRCLVESEQSLTNRLEAVCMQAPGTWRAPFDGKLPVVHVSDVSGSLLATNLTEPHRLSSSYVLEGTLDGDGNKEKNGNRLQDVLRAHLGVSEDGKRWPLDKRAELSRVVFALDPAAMLHGFQFMQWSAVGLRQQRLLHARMEAVLAGDSDVHYGMVKIDPFGDKPSGKHNNKGQSIAQKSRLVPESINATFELDVLGLRERWLVGEKPEPPTDKDDDEKKRKRTDALAQNVNAQKFLLALALWKIRQFLADQPAYDARTGQVERSLRLRSDCALRYSKITYRTQSNGAAFGDSQSLEIDALVKIESAAVKPLVDPPDFKPLLKAIAGREDLDIKVTYERSSAPKATESAGTPTPDGENDDEDADE